MIEVEGVLKDKTLSHSVGAEFSSEPLPPFPFPWGSLTSIDVAPSRLLPAPSLPHRLFLVALV